jgi:cell division protein FtsI/penicillin-binding protein 2
MMTSTTLRTRSFPVFRQPAALLFLLVLALLTTVLVTRLIWLKTDVPPLEESIFVIPLQDTTGHRDSLARLVRDNTVTGGFRIVDPNNSSSCVDLPVDLYWYFRLTDKERRHQESFPRQVCLADGLLFDIRDAALAPVDAAQQNRFNPHRRVLANPYVPHLNFTDELPVTVDGAVLPITGQGGQETLLSVRGAAVLFKVDERARKDTICLGATALGKLHDRKFEELWFTVQDSRMPGKAGCITFTLDDAPVWSPDKERLTSLHWPDQDSGRLVVSNKLAGLTQDDQLEMLSKAPWHGAILHLDRENHEGADNGQPDADGILVAADALVFDYTCVGIDLMSLKRSNDETDPNWRRLCFVQLSQRTVDESTVMTRGTMTRETANLQFRLTEDRYQIFPVTAQPHSTVTDREIPYHPRDLLHRLVETEFFVIKRLPPEMLPPALRPVPLTPAELETTPLSKLDIALPIQIVTIDDLLRMGYPLPAVSDAADQIHNRHFRNLSNRRRRKLLAVIQSVNTALLRKDFHTARRFLEFETVRILQTNPRVHGLRADAQSPPTSGLIVENLPVRIIGVKQHAFEQSGTSRREVAPVSPAGGRWNGLLTVREGREEVMPLLEIQHSPVSGNPGLMTAAFLGSTSGSFNVCITDDSPRIPTGPVSSKHLQNASATRGILQPPDRKTEVLVIRGGQFEFAEKGEQRPMAYWGTPASGSLCKQTFRVNLEALKNPGMPLVSGVYGRDALTELGPEAWYWQAGQHTFVLRNDGGVISRPPQNTGHAGREYLFHQSLYWLHKGSPATFESQLKIPGLHGNNNLLAIFDELKLSIHRSLQVGLFAMLNTYRAAVDNHPDVTTRLVQCDDPQKTQAGEASFTCRPVARKVMAAVMNYSTGEILAAVELPLGLPYVTPRNQPTAGRPVIHERRIAARKNNAMATIRAGLSGLRQAKPLLKSFIALNEASGVGEYSARFQPIMQTLQSMAEFGPRVLALDEARKSIFTGAVPAGGYSHALDNAMIRYEQVLLDTIRPGQSGFDPRAAAATFDAPSCPGIICGRQNIDVLTDRAYVFPFDSQLVDVPVAPGSIAKIITYEAFMDKLVSQGFSDLEGYQQLAAKSLKIGKAAPVRSVSGAAADGELWPLEKGMAKSCNVQATTCRLELLPPSGIADRIEFWEKKSPQRPPFMGGTDAYKNPSAWVPGKTFTDDNLPLFHRFYYMNRASLENDAFFGKWCSLGLLDHGVFGSESVCSVVNPGKWQDLWSRLFHWQALPHAVLPSGGFDFNLSSHQMAAIHPVSIRKLVDPAWGQAMALTPLYTMSVAARVAPCPDHDRDCQPPLPSIFEQAFATQNLATAGADKPVDQSTLLPVNPQVKEAMLWALSDVTSEAAHGTAWKPFRNLELQRNYKIVGKTGTAEWVQNRIPLSTAMKVLPTRFPKAEYKSFVGLVVVDDGSGALKAPDDPNHHLLVYTRMEGYVGYKNMLSPVTLARWILEDSGLRFGFAGVQPSIPLRNQTDIAEINNEIQWGNKGTVAITFNNASAATLPMLLTKLAARGGARIATFFIALDKLEETSGLNLIRQILAAGHHIGVLVPDEFAANDTGSGDGIYTAAEKALTLIEHESTAAGVKFLPYVRFENELQARRWRSVVRPLVTAVVGTDIRAHDGKTIGELVEQSIRQGGGVVSFEGETDDIADHVAEFLDMLAAQPYRTNLAALTDRNHFPEYSGPVSALDPADFAGVRP